MAKTPHHIKLQGYRHGGQEIARLGEEVRSFKSASPLVVVQPTNNGNLKVITMKGQYELTPSMVQDNCWMGNAGDVRVNFVKKKLVATLTYWA